jgi:hypothetical protein
MKKLRNSFSFSAVLLSAGLLFFAPQAALADTTGTLLPSSAGTYAQWTPSTGTTHYTLVNEISCNGTTNYVQTTTTANRDSYGINLTSIPDGATITQITITPCASRSSGKMFGSSVLNIFYRYSGVDSADAGSYALTGTTPTVLSTTSFSGLSKIKSSTSTLEIGGVFTSGNSGARLSQISTNVTYTPLNAPSSLTASVSATASGSAGLLHWTDNATTELGFKIERGTDGINFTPINVVGANSTSYTDPAPLTSGVTYYYRVRAYNSGGNSAYSNVANITIP